MMTQPRSAWITLLPAVLVCVIASRYSMGEVLDKSTNIGGTTVFYKVILPNHYDPGKSYPAVLAFGGGPQTMDVVENTIKRNWRDEAERRGYIVVLPAAPSGVLFFEGGERIFPEFLEKMLGDYKILDHKFHIAGISNGGISAFHIAALYPQHFLSITAFPGFLPEPTDARVQAISKLCINMHVGEFDQLGWTGEIQQQAAMLKKKGLNVQFTIEKGQPHRLDTFAGTGAKRLFDEFEQARQGCAK
jgi:poly(3-hydroxybutyrate) depolymerase